MNYSTWIEEKNLKKTFIVATLCSTIVGTFTTTMNLYDAVQARKEQKKTDGKQNQELEALRKRIDQAEERAKEKDKERDEYTRNFQHSSQLIQRQYDEGYGRLGSRFAQGDTITENLLQKQIIQLQQTVINVLQDALYNDRQLSRADMAKLAAASDAAREGSIDALRQQQQRLAGIDEPPSRRDSPMRALPAPKRASTVVEDEPLFCRYALSVQFRPAKPLAGDFAPGGDCRCPDCGRRIDATADDFWQIGKRTPVVYGGKEVTEAREFHLGQRFVIKCHTPDGDYACVLCNKHRDRDAVCRTVEALVNHVGRFHDVEELEREVDLKETVPMVLAAPR
ncbi:hypothetical protein DPSP01_000430 [Paraphaeosphaeria sporulosa]|uniref:Uncharacterized protein n=1 Tax=Paraphaeosphaeria sporulosa TaxID=1460663 RepID=A0A177C9K3_9PLEO|nr:uncharacterized protein CC84DRAFT_1096113 [Paraphaeosphaeria sporulosa]OAG03532.1 hypothetical protein CC84DRAFT_1096113 [Paraphaeosphaeria sporulosa]